VLVREWHTDTWQLDKIMEVQVPRTFKTQDFSNYVHEQLFSHIPKQLFFGHRVAFMKTFGRSDLMMQSWFHMTAGQAGKTLASGDLKISRDSVLIIVKNKQTEER